MTIERGKREKKGKIEMREMRKSFLAQELDKILKSARLLAAKELKGAN